MNANTIKFIKVTFFTNKIMRVLEKFRDFAPALLRYGLGLVYLWFGISQWLNPNYFIGYLPSFIFNSGFAQTFVLINGTFEIIAGILLILGIFTRIVALLLGLHLLAILIDLGYGDVAIRDFGLAISTITIALFGNDKYCLGRRIWKKKRTQ